MPIEMTVQVYHKGIAGPCFIYILVTVPGQLRLPAQT